MTPKISQIGMKVAFTVAALCLVTGTSTAQLSKKGPWKDPCAGIYPRTSPGAPVSCDLTGRIDLPVEQWLSQGERSEIPWKVSLSKPQLSFRLRNLVMVKAEIDVEVLHKQSIQDELVFIVKAAPANGKWSTQGKYTGYHVWRGFYPSGKLVMLAGIFLQPGTYTIAMMVYDPVSEKRNLSFSRIQVPGPTTGEAAELLGGLPEIDFRGSGPVGSERFLLPVKTQRPIQFDLIVDLSTREEGRRWDLPSSPYQARGAANPLPTPDTERWPPAIEKDPSKLTGTAQEQTREQSRLLEIASVFKELDFQPGCARVTALDVLRLRTLLPPTAANAVDWRQLGNENSASDKVVISVAGLEGRKDAGKFFQEQIAQIAAQPPNCQPDSANPLHVIAILSYGIHFPPGSNKLKLEAACNCKLFYFYASGPYIGGGDDLKNMLKPLSPEVLTFSNSQGFRERLLEFAEAIKKASAQHLRLRASARRGLRRIFKELPGPVTCPRIS